MIVSKQKYFYEAFVLTGANLQRLAEIFQQCIGQPSFEVECCDGGNQRFDNLGKLLSLENRPFGRVRSFWIVSANEETMRRARLRFSAVHAPVYLDVAAEAHVATGIDDAVTGQLETMQPAYTKRRPCDLALALLAGFAATVAAFYAVVALGTVWQSPAWTGRAIAILLFGGEAVGFGLAIAVGWLAHRPKGPLFPTATFVLAGGVPRQRLLAGLRWAVFAVAAGTLLAMTFLNFGT